MKPEAQRIAIAEFCGWKRGKKAEQSFADPSKDIASDTWIHPNGFPERKLPDYLNDLNAIHEAEKLLTDDQADQYAYILSVNMETRAHLAYQNKWRMVHATAAQRSEALLRTSGKWDYK